MSKHKRRCERCVLRLDIFAEMTCRRKHSTSLPNRMKDTHSFKGKCWKQEGHALS